MSPLADDLNTFRVFRGFPPRDQDESLPGPAGAGEEPELAEEVLAGAEIDLKVLAEKVYVLLRQEARLERERLVRNRPW
jgi:hypothetical protein